MWLWLRQRCVRLCVEPLLVVVPGGLRFSCASSCLASPPARQARRRHTRPHPPRSCPAGCLQAHVALYLHQNFVDCVEAAASQRALGAAASGVLRELMQLHGVVLLLEASSDLLEGGYCSGEPAGEQVGAVEGGLRWGAGGLGPGADQAVVGPWQAPEWHQLSAPPSHLPAGRQAGMLREQQRALVRSLRPNAISLADSFAYPDYQLNSALGRKDGNVYQVGSRQAGWLQRVAAGAVARVRRAVGRQPSRAARSQRASLCAVGAVLRRRCWTARASAR